MTEISNSNSDDLTNLSLKLLADQKIVFSLMPDFNLSIFSNISHLSDKQFNYLNEYLFEPNDNISIRTFSKFRYTEFREIFDLLIKFLNNSQNDQNTNFSLSQELSEILTNEPYSINQITIITEYLKRYPNLKKIYFKLYNYLEKIRNFYQSILWPLEYNITEDNQNFIYYYNKNYQDNRYLNRYVLGNRIFRITFLQNKFSPLTYYLTKRYISYINKTPEYEDYINQAIKSSEYKEFMNQRMTSSEIENFETPVLFRGIHSRQAKDIMNSLPGDTLIFKGFQSQTYDDYKAYKFTQSFEKEVITEIIKTKNEPDKILKTYDYNNIGILLKIKYPKNFKFLCFNREEAEILTYPNCRYQIEKIYFDDFVITCDLNYLDHDLESVKINFQDFDLKFLVVLEYFNYTPFYLEWFKLYMYFLEKMEILEKLIRENNLESMIEEKRKEIFEKITEKNYLEWFENYINYLAGMEKGEVMAFLSYVEDDKFEKLREKNIDDKISLEILEDIERYFKK